MATAVGSLGGGRFANEKSARTMLVGSIGAAVSLLVLYLGGAIAFIVALALLGLGLFALGQVPAFQFRVLSLAGPGGQLAAALPASSANAGIAVGSVIGGVAIGSSASGAVVTGLIIAVIAIAVAWAVSFLKPPVVGETAEPATAAETTAEVA